MKVKHGASDNMRANGYCYCYHQFIPHSSLDHNQATNTQYLLDDALYFSVSVEVDYLNIGWSALTATIVEPLKVLQQL